MNLYEILGVDEDVEYANIDKIYRNISIKTEEKYLAWKVLRDKFYSSIYKKYKDINFVIDAGFIDDKLNEDEVDFYKLNLFTTPFGKILDNIKCAKKPVVLLSTGGFCPIHKGHMYMMEMAKKVLEEKGYDVVGGYLSPSHDNYVKTKPGVLIDCETRIYNCQMKVMNSNWLMIDPFESMYVKTYVNFTDIINRLELYLKKYVDERIKVVYVFGADNAKFSYCFENIGMCVCVERQTGNIIYKKLKENIKCDNIIFIDNFSTYKNYSSRNFRNSERMTINNNGTYIVRNEGVLPFLYLGYNDKVLLKCQRKALEDFKSLLHEYINNDIKIVDVEKQIETAKIDLCNKNVISLDPYFEGKYNLRISRQFEVCDLQKSFTRLTDIELNILSGDYILLDDDTVSGQTLDTVLRMLPEKVNITSTYFLANCLCEKVFDVVDFRDFIIGSEGGGLMVRLKNKCVRVPYIAPFVSLFSRANIPLDKQVEFSRRIIGINIDFYGTLNKDIKLCELQSNAITLFTALGYARDCHFISILEDLKKI